MHKAKLALLAKPLFEIKVLDVMASRKRKSISYKPHVHFDTRRFQSLEAWNRYTDNILDRRILPERNEGSIDEAMVKEFYANLYSSKDQVPKCARVRSRMIKIDVEILNEFLQTPVLLEEGESLPTYSRFCRLRSDPREMEVILCIPGKGFVLNVEGQPWKLLRKDLTTLAQT
ncbi:hypothetical protein HKD37_13G035545 [Glycine soja]